MVSCAWRIIVGVALSISLCLRAFTYNMRRILLATDAAFYPPFQGDSARLLLLIQAMQRRGWCVHVVHFHDCQQRDVDYGQMSRLVEQLVVYFPSDEDLARRKNEKIDEWCPKNFALLVKNTCKSIRPDAVFAQFVFLSRCLSVIKSSPNLCKVLDADNIFAGRREKYCASGLPYAWFSTSEAEERKGWQRADLLISIQECEYDIITRAMPNRPVVLVPHAHSVTDSGPGNGRSILFVGADNEANAAGLQAFVADALPGIRRQYPAATLVIAGRVGQRFRGIPGVSVQGVVADLTALYRDASIALNVVPCGTGIKIKTVEALCHGKCLVSTPAGIEGLERYPEVYHTAQTQRALGKIIENLMTRPNEMEVTRLAALRFAREYFAPDAVYGRLEAGILQCLDGTRPL